MKDSYDDMKRAVSDSQGFVLELRTPHHRKPACYIELGEWTGNIKSFHCNSIVSRHRCLVL
jgi:hypothetical protein